MSANTDYLVLARKCRPQTFEDVLGQEHVTKTLKNAISQERIPHALLFGGPRGVGKTSVARIMAKALNCEKGPTPAPCNVCVNCREITAGSSLDVREIDGASNRGIDEIRELREQVYFSPVSSAYRIYIIDEVHMLTREAFNALLKTLEEPPHHAVFVFATTESHKVPATIISRCQCFDFRRISIRQIADSLKAIAGNEGIGISDRALTWLAESSEGSLRDAQSLFDKVISYSGKDVGDEAVEELLGLTDRRFLYPLALAVLKRDAALCLKILEDAFFSGIDLFNFYGMLLKHFRNLLIVKILGREASLVDLAPDEVSELKTQTEEGEQDDLKRLLDILLGEEEKIKRSFDPKISIELLLVKMAGREPFLPLDAVISRMEDLEKKLAGGINLPAPLEPKEQSREGASARDQNAEGNIWERYLAFLKKINPVVCSKLENGRYLGYEQGILKLGFFRNYLFLDDIKTARIEELKRLSKDFFPELADIVIEVFDPEPQEQGKDGLNGTSRVSGLNHLRQEAINHPLVQRVLDVFPEAEIREIIIKKQNNNHSGGK